jgi:hypothetical protein
MNIGTVKARAQGIVQDNDRIKKVYSRNQIGYGLRKYRQDTREKPKPISITGYNKLQTQREMEWGRR